MQRMIVAAAILLILQIGLVVGFKMQDNQYEPFSANEPLISYTPDTIDSISITAEDKGELTLSRKPGGWFIAGKDDVPANSAQVDTFLKNLAAFRRGLAVATTKNAAQRFEVSPEKYNSRIVLRENGKIAADLYFGTSAGFKQLHARTAGSNEIVTVVLGSHEVSPKVEQWIDKEILLLPQDQLISVDIDGYSIVRDGESGWKAVDPATGEEKQLADGGKLIDKICTLNIQDVIADDTAGSSDKEENLSFSLTIKEKGKLEYVFSKLEENTYAVKRSDMKLLWSISGWQTDEIIELKNTIIAHIDGQDEGGDKTEDNDPTADSMQ